MPLSMFR